MKKKPRRSRKIRQKMRRKTSLRRRISRVFVSVIKKKRNAVVVVVAVAAAVVAQVAVAQKVRVRAKRKTRVEVAARARKTKGEKVLAQNPRNLTSIHLEYWRDLRQIISTELC